MWPEAVQVDLTIGKSGLCLVDVTDIATPEGLHRVVFDRDRDAIFTGDFLLDRWIVLRPKLALGFQIRPVSLETSVLRNITAVSGLTSLVSMIIRITSPDSYISALNAALSAAGTARAAPRRQAAIEMDFMVGQRVLKAAASERPENRSRCSGRHWPPIYHRGACWSM